MIDLHATELGLVAAQCLLWAFDTIYHHELTEALPQRADASRELAWLVTFALPDGFLQALAALPDAGGLRPAITGASAA